MSISEALVGEFAHESAITRRLLEMVPEEHLGWKPRDNSMSLSDLAGHVAQIPCWIHTIMAQEGVDMAAEPPFTPVEPAGLDELLVEFGSRVGDFHRALAGAADAELQAAWTLKRGEQVITTMSRTTAIRRFILGHLVHHRGQLSVYLWMLGVPIPEIYRPVARHRDLTVEESESNRDSPAPGLAEEVAAVV